MKRISNIGQWIEEVIPERWDKLRIAETTALTATVVAFAVSLVAVKAGPAVETNAAPAVLIGSLSWTAAGLVAVGGIHAIFAVYRRVSHIAPRIVLAGSALIVGHSLVDLLWSSHVALRAGLEGAVDSATLVPIIVVAGAAVVLVWRPVPRVAMGHIRMPGLRQTTLSVMLLMVTLMPVVATVALPGGVSMSPASEVRGEISSYLQDDFEDQDLTEWTVDGNGNGFTPHTVTSPVYEGSNSVYLRKFSSIENQTANAPISSFKSVTFYIYVEQADVVNSTVKTTLKDTDIASSSAKPQLQFTGSGTITDYSGDIIGQYNKNQWYRIDMSVNYTNNTFDAIISSGGSLVAEKKGIEVGNMNGIDRFFIGGGSNGIVYADKVSYNTEPFSTSGSSKSTPTPTPDSQEYTLSVCYTDGAEFQSVGATASWFPSPADASNTWAPDDVTYGEGDTSEFNRYGETTQEVLSSPNVSYRVGVESDRASFVFWGLNPTRSNTHDKVAIASPFSKWYQDPEQISSDGVCGDENRSDTPSPTAIPGTPPSDAEPVALGTCTVPAANGTKTGLLVEYWDPTMSTESIWFNLSYRGHSMHEYVEFDSPKGYYFGCHAVGDGINPGDRGSPTPYPTPTAWPNGTYPTPYPAPTAYPAPEPPEINGSANFTDGSSSNFSEIGFADTDPANSIDGSLESGILGPTGGGGSGGSPIVGLALVGGAAFAALRYTGADKQLAQAAKKVAGRLR